jgi:hypothetical protein
MGTANRTTAVVRLYGHSRRLEGFHFSQQSPVGAWMLRAPTTYAASRPSHSTTLNRPIPQSSSAKKVRHSEFSEKFGILAKHHVSNDATENAWFLSNLICLPGNGP